MLLRALSQQLPPAGYGVLALGLPGSLLFSQAISGGATAAIGRYFSAAQEARALLPYGCVSLQLLLRDQRRVVAVSVVAMLLLVLTGQGRWTPLAVAAALASMSASWLMALVTVLTAARRLLAASTLSALDPWLKLVLLTLWWRDWPVTPAQALLLNGLSNAVLAVAVAKALYCRLGLSLRLLRSAQAEAELT